MPFAAPPEKFQLKPRKTLLPADTMLWRVHKRHRPAEQFNTKNSDMVWSGGRFDGTVQCSYPFMYAAFEETTAVAETLLRAMQFLGSRPRTLARPAVEGRRLSAVTLTSDVTLLSLTSTPALAGVAQDEWLVHAEPVFYAQTRDWAHWIRDHAPWAQGLIWPSKRDLGRDAVMLFGDRCDDVLAPMPGRCIDLDDELGRMWLNTALADYRIYLHRSPRWARQRLN
jgi:RES domain